MVITTSLNALTSRTRDDGQWSLYLDPNEPSAANIAVTATAPGGGTATLNGVSVQPKAAVVVPTIHLP